jgi:hypothetical protein
MGWPTRWWITLINSYGSRRRRRSTRCTAASVGPCATCHCWRIHFPLTVRRRPHTPPKDPKIPRTTRTKHGKLHARMPTPSPAFTPRVLPSWSAQLLSGTARVARPRLPTRSPPSAHFLRTLFSQASAKAASASAPRLPQAAHHSALAALRFHRSALARRFRSLRFNSDKPTPRHHDPTPHLGSPDPAPSLSQKLKQLSREYGWAALGVYFALSALDFPVCFIAVRLLGTDRIGRYEAVVKDAFWNVVRLAFPNAGTTSDEAEAASVTEDATLREGSLGADMAVQARSGGDACTYLRCIYHV